MEDGWARRRRIIAEEYERIAIEVIAERGYDEVTMEEIAEAIGVSTRTLTRQFRTKEDLLLSLPRRSARAMVEALAVAESTDEPVADVFELWVELSAAYGAHLDFFFRWQRAAKTAPEIVARARGVQNELIVAELVDRCAQALSADPATDLAPHVLAGALCGVNGAVVDYWLASNATADLSRLFVDALVTLRSHFASGRHDRLVVQHRATSTSTESEHTFLRSSA